MTRHDPSRTGSGPLVVTLLPDLPHTPGGAEALAAAQASARAAVLADALGGSGALALVHTFPDGESLVTVPTEVAGRDVVLLAELHRPDARLLPLLCAADTLREYGARSVKLAAPYLPYMRQDTRFAPGQAVSSRTFAALLCSRFDFIATVDPHLHRYAALGEVYTVPTAAVAAAPAIARWIGQEVASPLLIGPDEESSQWVRAIAQAAGAPFEVLAKIRRGDREVQVSALGGHWQGGALPTPVLADDIISSARTMIEAVRQVRAAGLPAPVCIGVHAVFADGAYEALQQAGAGRVVSCNTIAHASNAIDVLPDLARALAGG